MTMQGKKGNRWRVRLASRTLAVALLLSLCVGCGHSIQPPDGGGADGGTSVAQTADLNWESVITGAEINTLNVVLVIDESSSILKNDPERNCLEAACMFLDTHYASASQNESKRLAGSKRVNVDVILYNNDVDIYADTPYNLASKDTVVELKKFVRKAKDTTGGEDGALAKALNSAVNILDNLPDNQKTLSSRSLILLFTDGYTPKGSARPLSASRSSTQSGGFSGTYGTSGAADSGSPYGAGGASGYASYGAVPMPDFGENQAELETALSRAKERNYAIYVLMSNLQDSADGGWEQFQRIAEYTKRNLMGELMEVLYKHWDLFGDMSINDFTWPKGYELAKPTFLDDPMSGGGVFPNPDGGDEKVNYWEAKSSTKLMDFYTTLAANMLSGSSATVCVPVMDTIHETITSNGKTEDVWRDTCRYDIDIPDSGISALMCFCFSPDGLEAVHPKGPDPEQSGERRGYALDLRDKKNNGWASVGEMTMRNDWYDNGNISTLIIINPEPGLWSIYARGKNGSNRFLRTYATLVSGAKDDVFFAQGNDPEDGEYPVTTGYFEVRGTKRQSSDDEIGVPLSEEFYKTLKTQCDATRIPPWLPISEKDIPALMQDFPAWLEGVLKNFKKPETMLTQMSGGKIEFTPDTDSDGNPALTGQFEAPLPGLYYVTLNMTAGEGASKIDYGKSFWVMYEAKTDYTVYCRANRDTSVEPSFPDAWGKISNADISETDIPEVEDLELEIDVKNAKITPSNLATINADSKNQNALVIHGNRKGEGRLSVDVTTKYGEKWTLDYKVIVH